MRGVERHSGGVNVAVRNDDFATVVGSIDGRARLDPFDPSLEVLDDDLVTPAGRRISTSRPGGKFCRMSLNAKPFATDPTPRVAKTSAG